MSTRYPVKDIEFIASFAAFCRTKGDEAYRFNSTRECAACQFLKASGRAARPLVGGDYWLDLDDPRRHARGFQRLPEIDDRALRPMPHTFSALADRLERLLVDAPVVERG